ncbi:MAG TPA: oligosaccharide flippase family protein [Patescibacteria group bacterium]|jgi:O-antigen/teichoic acid export membrane protein|nr:oligosaccharide flippase family protein [Patescibacteria group bacterium]
MQHKLIAKNTSYQILARGIASFIGFLITLVIARKFGVLGYGDFTKITSYVALFYLVIDFGLNAFFLQYENARFKNLFYLRMLISIGIFLLLNALAFFLPYNAVLGTGFSGAERFGIFIFSFGIFAQSIILSTSAIFQKAVNYYFYMVGTIIGSIVNLIVVLIFAFLNLSIMYILFGFVVSSFVGALALLFFAKEKISPPSIDKEFAVKIMLASWPLGLMLIFNLVYFRVDIFLLSILKTTQDVGIYGLSYKFFDFLIALPLFLSNAVYPFLIKAKADKKLFFNLTGKYFLIFLIASFITIIPFWFISPLFTLVKADFTASILPFRILLLSLPFFFTTSFLQWVLITLGKQKYLMIVYFLSTLLNVALNIIFIPQFSYVACATITLLSEGIVFVFLLVQLLKYRIILERKAETSV